MRSASAPSGWVPCDTCGSWLGSPSRTSDSAASATLSTVASASWPASSTNSTSTSALERPRAPTPTTSRRRRPTRPSRSPADRARGGPDPLDAESSAMSLVVVRWPRRTDTLGRAARATASSRSAITRCDCAVTPTRLPVPTRSRIIRAAGDVLPVPGGPWIASTVSSSPACRRRPTAVPARRPARGPARRQPVDPRRDAGGGGRAPRGTGQARRSLLGRPARRAAPAPCASARRRTAVPGSAPPGGGCRVALGRGCRPAGPSRDRHPRRLPALGPRERAR